MLKKSEKEFDLMILGCILLIMRSIINRAVQCNHTITGAAQGQPKRCSAISTKSDQFSPPKASSAIHFLDSPSGEIDIVKLFQLRTSLTY